MLSLLFSVGSEQVNCTMTKTTGQNYNQASYSLSSQESNTLCVSPFPSSGNPNTCHAISSHSNDQKTISAWDSGYLSEYDNDCQQDARELCHQENSFYFSPIPSVMNLTSQRCVENLNQSLQGSCGIQTNSHVPSLQNILPGVMSGSTPKTAGLKRKFSEMVGGENGEKCVHYSKTHQSGTVQNTFLDLNRETTPVNTRTSVAIKPQKSYLEIITEALLASPEHKLILADIYQYFLTKYTFFHTTTCAWRNSIRYCLSANECFVKNGRAPKNRGYYWSIHPACIDDFIRGDFNRRKARKRVQQINQKLKSHIKASNKVSASDLLFVKTESAQMTAEPMQQIVTEAIPNEWYAGYKNNYTSGNGFKVPYC
jgi:hypothetical protein